MKPKVILILILSFLFSGIVFADPDVTPKKPITPDDIATTKTILKDLVAINTTNPPGNELSVAYYAKNFFATFWKEERQKIVEETEDEVEKKKLSRSRSPIRVQIFESAKNRGNFIARIKGNGTKKPLLITAHIDVVGAKAENWDSDPFKVSERDGYYYGRGVLDDKGMAAAGMMVMKLLARNKVPLDRDVILFLGADEESGSKFGMGWVLEYNATAVEAEVVLNEGGRLLLENGKITHAAVQNYEKLFMNVILSTEGVSGHSSAPNRNNAITRLARAVAAVGGYQFAPELNDITKKYFEGLSKIPNHPLKEEFKAISSGKTKGKKFRAAFTKISEDPSWNAMLRTTCTPTLVNAGFRHNAIPGEAEATINCRVLPTQKREAVLAQLKLAINDPEVQLEADDMEEPVMSPANHDFFKAVQKVMGEMAPGAVTVPYMSTGATDSRTLRHKGMNAYGLVPFPLSADDVSRMHGDNERLKVSSIDFGVEFLYKLVLEFAATQ